MRHITYYVPTTTTVLLWCTVGKKLKIMTGQIRYGKIITLTSLSSYSKRTSLFGYDQVVKKLFVFCRELL